MAKSKYISHVQPNLEKIAEWASNGLTEGEIAANLGISEASWFNYRLAHLEVLEFLKKGREIANVKVENALYKSAIGYECEEITEERDKDGNLVETKRVTKNVPPSNTAQIFWLKNRKPSEWKDKQEVNVGQEKPFEVNLTVIK